MQGEVHHSAGQCTSASQSSVCFSIFHSRIKKNISHTVEACRAVSTKNILRFCSLHDSQFYNSYLLHTGLRSAPQFIHGLKWAVLFPLTLIQEQRFSGVLYLFFVLCCTRCCVFLLVEIYIPLSAGPQSGLLSELWAGASGLCRHTAGESCF